MVLRVGFAAENVMLLPNSVTQSLFFGNKHDAKAPPHDTESKPEVPEWAMDKYFTMKWQDGPPQILITEDTFLTESLGLYFSPYPLPEIKRDVREKAGIQLEPYEIQIFRRLVDTIDAYFSIWINRMTLDTNFNLWGRVYSDGILNQQIWILADLVDRPVQVEEGCFILRNFHDKDYNGELGVGLELQGRRLLPASEEPCLVNMGHWEKFIPHAKLKSRYPGFKAAERVPKEQTLEDQLGFVVIEVEDTG
ncbi:MAG: hypothetical protein LQ351_007976 [Letrouitia transgressa]|nr:MAG: hypothetical protein LQ351_007976 [Letrouitia transgressa]